MIQIPPKAVLDLTSDWCFLHFKDIAHDQEAPAHYYLTIPINPGALFVLCIITSRVENRLYHYQKVNKKAAQALVRLDPGSFAFLPKESALDCNRAELLSIEEVQRKIRDPGGFSMQNPKIPDSLKKRVIDAIQNSPLIPKAVKDHLAP